ncbi:MAG: glycosyltransferase [Prevotella sp.]|nr:glycosyltransferase [Prevotella sp.]
MGGAEKLLVDLLPRLKDAGEQVDLLLFDGTQTPFYNQLRDKGIKIYSLGRGKFSMYNPMHLFKLKKYMKQYGVVHTHNTPCQLLAAMAGCNKPRLITTEHSTNNRRRSWSCWRDIDSWMYRKYSKIICVSKAAADNLLEYISDKNIQEKVCVIQNGIDIAKYREAVPDKKLQEQYKGKHIVVMVAAFRKGKDQKTVIRAMKQLTDDYVLFLAGDGECRKECEEETALLGLTDRVCFLGNCTDVPSLLATAEVVVLSSHHEGLSLSMIEGMASGKVCIVSDVIGLREIVGGAGLLFPYKDDAELASLIQRVCNDKKFYNSVAMKCYERAMQYDIRTTVEGYRNIYNINITD